MSIEVIRKDLPGRLRLSVPMIYRHELNAQGLESAVLGLPYMRSAKANPLTGSILLIYDSQVRDRERVLEDLQHLMGLSGSITALALSSRPSDTLPPRPVKRRALSIPSRRPLRLESPPPKTKAAQWHATPIPDVLKILEATEFGLTPPVAQERLQRFGPNSLEVSYPRSMLSFFVGQFLTVPVGMLGISAVVSLATGGIADAAVIGGVVLINALIGTLTERAAEKTINALGALLPSHAGVLRGGEKRDIPLEEVVPGDVLILVPGAYIPADARLLVTKNLTIDESALTGESLPVLKRHGALCDPKAPLGERYNMIHMGTLVTGGSGFAVVTACGRWTEIGAIQALVGQVSTPQTPLQQQLDQLGTRLAGFSAGLCVLVFVTGMVRGQGWLKMLSSSISLAVAAVPEGLPTVATTTLALGLGEMKRRKVLIRRLHAVESLGSMQVLCLDKTGTLTMNQMKVVMVHQGAHAVVAVKGGFRDAAGEMIAPAVLTDIRRLLEVVTLCSEVKVTEVAGQLVLEGSPTEKALIEAALLGGVEPLVLRASRPLKTLNHRAELRPYMMSIHSQGSGYWIAVKGSPSEVLGLCTRRWVKNGLEPLSDDDRRQILDANESMAGDALRVLGVAMGDADSDAIDRPSKLTWLGLIGMEDMIRPGMPELMAQFHEAGIETVMITGDQSATAQSVGKRLGLGHGGDIEILDSLSLDQLEPELLANIVGDTTIFARVSPAQKLRVVEALQKGGRVIAMTGDGINDSPALKAADIGVAMGQQGAHAARSVADVILEDDNLHTLIAAVEQGRTIYGNIRKSVRFLMTTNLSEIELMLVTTALGFGEALNPMQLLWINLVTDIFPALALAMEPPEQNIMKKPPRDPARSIIDRQDSLRLLRESTLISGGALAVYLLSMARYGPGPKASTNSFMTLTLAQMLQAISCRSEDTSILTKDRPPNHYLDLAVAGGVGLQLLTVLLPPLRALLRLSPLTTSDVLLILIGTGSPFLTNEAAKHFLTAPALGAQKR